MTLTAQLVGYKQADAVVTVRAGELATVNLVLTETAIALDEVVVTGAGVATQRRKLGNTIATIDATRVLNPAVTDVSQMLAAREPGVSVLPGGGYTGEGARIRIRGSSSLSQNNEPVIYVDGIRVDRSASAYAPQGNPSKLDDIPPDAIERIEILKGAAAATLYGTEASNGVIQIFTKKGRAGAPRFTLQVEQTAIQQIRNRIEPLADFAETEADQRRIAARWGRTVQLFQPFQEDLMGSYFATGHNQTYRLSVTGGSDRVNYFVTGGIVDEDGPIAFNKLFPDRTGLRETNDELSRAQMQANVVITPLEKVRLGVNTMYSELRAQVPNNGNNIYGVFPNLTQSFLRLACTEVSADCPKVNRYGTNAFMTANEAIYQYTGLEQNHFTGSANINYSPVTAIKLDGTFGIDFVNESQTFFRPYGWTVDNYATVDGQGVRSVDEVRRRVLTADFKASHEGRMGEDVSSTLLLGAQGFLRQRQNRNGTGRGFPGPGLEVTGAGVDRTTGESWERNTQIGAYIQEQVGWQDWAFVTVGGRWDANSAFGEEFQTAFYPKANISLVPASAFDWTSTTFSTLRFRAAIGRSGLQPSSFAKFTTYQSRSSTEGAGIRPANLGNQNLKPEVSTEIEAGAEMGLFQDRAAVNVTYWTTTVKDAMVPRQFPVSGGFINTQLDNIGELQKHGVDLGVRGKVVNRDNLSVDLFVNGAYLSQEITDMGGAPALKTGGSYSRYRQYLTQGYAPGSFFGAKLADFAAIPLNLGFRNTDGSCREPTQAEALAYFGVARDPSSFKPLVYANRGLGETIDGALASHNCGTGPLNTYLGKSTPDWQGTFGFNLGFLGNFEVISIFEFKAGDFSVHDLSGEFRRSSPTIGRNTPECVGYEATMRNPGSTAQGRLDAALGWARRCEGLAPLDGLNSIDPADHIRWRELNLMYQVPVRFVDQLGLAGATLSLGVRNLALFVNSDFKGMDPEATLNGLCNGGLDCNFLDATDGWQVPVPRRITFSTRVSF